MTEGESRIQYFDKDYFKKLTDEEKEIYLYNVICYGVYSEIEIKEEEG